MAGQESPEQQNPGNQVNEAQVAAIVAVLLSGAALATSAAALAAIVKTSRNVATAALLAIHYKPGKKVPPKPNTAEAAARLGNLRYRAAFLKAATGRLAAADNIGAALKRERRLFQAHKVASQRRVEAATASDTLRSRYGPLLGWHAHLDERTTPDCGYLHGKNYLAEHPPGGLHPGARHMNCRCTAVAPFPGAPVVRKLPRRFGRDLLS